MFSLDVVLDKITEELDAIGRIERGRKVSTVDGLSLGILEDSITSSVYRRLHGDSRNRLIPYVEQRVQAAAAFAERILESKFLAVYDGASERTLITEDQVAMFNKRLEQANRLLQTLHSLPRGLKALAETYSDDRNIIFQLQSLAKSITNSIVPPLFLQMKSIREQRTRYVLEKERRLNKPAAIRAPQSLPIAIKSSSDHCDDIGISPGETF